MKPLKIVFFIMLIILNSLTTTSRRITLGKKKSGGNYSKYFFSYFKDKTKTEEDLKKKKQVEDVSKFVKHLENTKVTPINEMLLSFYLGEVGDFEKAKPQIDCFISKNSPETKKQEDLYIEFLKIIEYYLKNKVSKAIYSVISYFKSDHIDVKKYENEGRNKSYK